MPHADMSNWQSVFRNKKVERKQARSVEELAERGRLHRSEEMPHLRENMPDVAQAHREVALRAEGDTPLAEIYVPHGEGPFPVFVHIHGGGWFTGSPQQEERFSRTICAAGFVVVDVDYALAPDNPFPRGLEDCLYAVRWTKKNIAEYGGDPDRMFVGGGSAGGNLSAETSLVLHGGDFGRLDGGDLADVEVKLLGAVFLFGVLDVHRWIAEPHYYAGDSEIMVASYLGPNFTGKLRDPLVSPIEHPGIPELPPVYISCGAEDAFLSHSLRMTEKLANNDVPVTLSVVAGADHEFHKVPEFVSGAGPENERIIGWLKEHAK